MKIAYCLLAHKNPDQVSRLIEKLYSPTDYFYINVFRTNETAPLAYWQNIASKHGENIIVTPMPGGSRGTIRYSIANLDAMRSFSESQYDYFVNLSGQCYPLKPIAQIKEYLGSSGVAHMEHFSLPSSDHWGPRGGLDRVNYRWFKFRGRYIRVPRLTKRLPYNMHPYGGSPLFCLPRRHIDYVLDFVSRNPKILGFFKRAFAPEEMFFQTIIMNSPLKNEVVNKDEWYIDWSRAREGHPPILTKADLPLLLASEKLFARKFDVTVDSEVLDLIDKENAA